MYWPTPVARQLHVPPPLDHAPVKEIKSNRRGNLFVTLSDLGLSVWAVRPTVCIAAVTRTKASLERWGWNTDVTWSYDGRQLLVLTDSSHILLYDLVSTDNPAYIHPPSDTFPLGGGAGEGDDLTIIELKPAGTAFAMGGCKSILATHNGLLLCLTRPSALLRVPYPIASHLLTPPASHFPAVPLDGETEAQVECELWELSEASWISNNTSAVPVSLTVTRVPSLPAIYTMVCDDGRVYAFYSGHQVHLHSQDGSAAEDYHPSSATPQASQLQLSHAKTPPTPPFAKQPRFVGNSLWPPESSSAPGIDVAGPISESGEESSRAAAPSAEPGPSRLPDITPQASDFDRATSVAVNGKMGLVAIATNKGEIHVSKLPPYPQPPREAYSLSLKSAANLRSSPGKVTSLAWTSDGYVLAVGYERAWAVWSMGGRLNGWGMKEDQEGAVLTEEDNDEDLFMSGVQAMFWGPGNTELFVLADSQEAPVKQLYVIPFAKSATTSQHSPDNTRYAFLQLDDRVLVYRGADQPDMSVINPQSDVWQHIKIPNVYISTNWPLRYSTISSDGKLIAVAGRRGLTHYSSASGRWKLFVDEQQEASFSVRGGLLWFHHVLVAAVEVGRGYQIRLYSRDLDLSDSSILHLVNLSHPVLVMSLLDNSLLVYTADNTFYHFLILPTRDSIKLHLCGSISFKGIVAVPWRVRAMSWMVPKAQKKLGDPVEDLIVATIIFLIDGRLMLLRPRKAGSDEVRYDVQVLADRVESYWTHLHGIGTLENSLWGYDGTGVRVWLDALTIEGSRVDDEKDTYETVRESVYLRLDFYPLSILMDKGILIGVDHEASLSSSLPFAVFKIQTGTHLFLPHFLRYHLTHRGVDDALLMATTYKNLVYFAHAMEILLHSVLEDEVDAHNEASRSLAPSPDGVESSIQVQPDGILTTVIEFLDHFPEALEVVVGCARKTEVERWKFLFDIVGKPRDLFEDCMRKGLLKTATSYLLVLHNLEELDDTSDTLRLLKRAKAAKEHHLCKELLRFLHSIDDSGDALRAALDIVGVPSPADRLVAPAF